MRPFFGIRLIHSIFPLILILIQVILSQSSIAAPPTKKMKLTNIPTRKTVSACPDVVKHITQCVENHELRIDSKQSDRLVIMPSSNEAHWTRTFFAPDTDSFSMMNQIFSWGKDAGKEAIKSIQENKLIPVCQWGEDEHLIIQFEDGSECYESFCDNKPKKIKPFDKKISYERYNEPSRDKNKQVIFAGEEQLAHAQKAKYLMTTSVGACLCYV